MTDKFHDPQHGGPPSVIVEAAAAKIAVTVMSVIVTIYAQLQGIGILAGGSARFSADHSAYTIASSFPGGLFTWGSVIFACGVIGFWAVIMQHRRWCFWIFTILSCWSFAFALCFARAAAIYSGVSTTGMWTYGKDAAIYVTLAAVVYSNHYRRERNA